MLGLGLPELAILLVVLLVVLVVVRLSRVRRDEGGRARPPRLPRTPSPQALSTPVPATLQTRVRELAAGGKLIQGIKELRQATGLGLREAKEVAEAIAAGNALPVPGAPRPEQGSRDLAYRARTLAAGGQEAAAVRLVAGETGMSAPEATAFVRSLLP